MVVILDGKPHDLTRCRNEIWVGIPRTSFFATFAKSFLDSTRRTVADGLRFPMVGAGLESGCAVVGEMVV